MEVKLVTSIFVAPLAATLACGEPTSDPSESISASESSAAEATNDADSGMGSSSGGSSLDGDGSATTSSTSTADESSGSSGDGEACPNLLADGSFEAGLDTPWSTDSALLRTPLCDPTCLDGSPGAHAGEWWIWFGGTRLGESAHAQQAVVVPAGDGAWLSFYLRIPQAAGTGDDLLAVLIDGTTRMLLTDTDADDYPGYVQVVLDVSELADGGRHEVGFAANFPATGVSSFYVDSVRLGACEPEG